MAVRGFQESVIVVSFQDDSNAFDAITRLKELDSQHQIELEGGAVVARARDGHIVKKDEASEGELVNTAGGGLIGLLIGIIGGPLGVLIGGAAGVLVGSLFDLHDTDETASVLGEMSRTAQVGRNVVLAQVTEQSPDVIDTAMLRVGGSVLRRPVFEVEAEVAAADRAHRKARYAACKELISARHAKREETVHERVAELKAKLRGTRQGPPPAPEPASSLAASGAGVPARNYGQRSCR